MAIDQMQDTVSIARDAFAAIQASFPTLRLVEQPAAPVELSVVLPEQDGLKFRVCLSLQNYDELHFMVEHFWLEWFPCTDPGRVAAYVAAVTDFVSGKSRVVERYRGTRCVSAELQAPEGTTWHTIGKWSGVSLPFPLTSTYREIRNV